jgi:hypothetical protein
MFVLKLSADIIRGGEKERKKESRVHMSKRKKKATSLLADFEIFLGGWPIENIPPRYPCQPNMQAPLLFVGHGFFRKRDDKLYLKFYKNTVVHYIY